MKTTELFFLFLFLILTAAVISPAGESIAEARPQSIKIVMDNNYPPYVFKGSDGALQGILIDQWRLWEHKTGIKAEVTAMDWGRAMAGMKAGEFDVIDTIFKTEERSAWLDFTKPYANLEVPIFFENEISGITDAESLKGFPVAVKKGDDAVDVLKRSGVENLMLFDSYEAIISAAREKKVSVFVVDSPPARYFLHKFGIHDQYKKSAPLNVGQFHRAVKKGNSDLLGIVEEGFKQISEDEYKNIETKWYGSSLSVDRVPRYFFIIAGSIVLLIVILFIWNLALKISVDKRTAELKSTEMTLRKSEEKLRSYIDNSPDGVFVADENGHYIEINPAAERITGYSKSELLKMSIPDMLPAESAEAGVTHFSILKETGSSSGEFIFLHKSGVKRWWSVDAVKLSDTRFLGFTKDITERKTEKDKVKNLLAEKELLLEEVHHRIKNNMNTIKGLLTLQIAAEESPSATASLRDAESRVQSMIMLYDRLYCTDNYRELSVKDYLTSLADEIIGSFPNREIVKVKTDIEDFILNINTLSPLGIIVNELFTNMMKYAFTGRDSGVITLSASIKENHVKIVVQDDGVGIPESVSFEKSKGFGLDLVGMLTEQIGGSIKIERGVGTSFVLEFEV